MTAEILTVARAVSKGYPITCETEEGAILLARQIQQWTTVLSWEPPMNVKRESRTVTAWLPEGADPIAAAFARATLWLLNGRDPVAVPFEDEAQAERVVGALQQQWPATCKGNVVTIDFYSARPAGEVRIRKPIPKDVRAAVWQRDEGACRNCGITDAESMARDGEHLHYDPGIRQSPRWHSGW